jgi:K+-transporting ATPase KdpF subunit
VAHDGAFDGCRPVFTKSLRTAAKSLCHFNTAEPIVRGVDNAITNGAPMIWVAGVLVAGVFVYLFYALIKPERF